jgi:glutamate N-acetyltransferase / amino-acid N-acetyltransferase
MADNIPLGWRFAGVHAGFKSNADALDLALIVSDRPASAVGMFTTNRVCAAPVQVSRSRLPSKNIRGVVTNSGNANACTGEQGLRDAETMCRLAAQDVDADERGILVCSTGVIGRPMRMELVPEAVKQAVSKLGRSYADVDAAANAILTTDTCSKTSRRTLADGKASVFGFAKGAAMIGPNMATMLAFVVTDAVCDPDALGPILRYAVDASFHSISVEGHTSTNDTVLLLANGASNVTPGRNELQGAVAEVCMELAQAIIRDSEGATKFVTIDVAGAPDDIAARTIAKTVADSALVKSALFGNDPNWGRICSAAGYAGVPFEERDLTLVVNGSLLYDRGTPTPFDKGAESTRLAAGREIHLELRFTLGEGKCRFWTSDLSYDYVRLNAEYTT